MVELSQTAEPYEKCSFYFIQIGVWFALRLETKEFNGHYYVVSSHRYLPTEKIVQDRGVRPKTTLYQGLKTVQQTKF